MLHNIGALFPKKSKKGNKYYSGFICNPSKDDPVGLLIFQHESKTGKEYWAVNIAVDEEAGERTSEVLETLKDHLEKHIKHVKSNEEGGRDVDDSEVWED